MKRMKIAMLIRRYITTGGAERYAVEVARRIAKVHDLHVFAQSWDHEAEGMTLHQVPLLAEKPRVFNQWWFSWHTTRMTHGFDLVYTHERVTRFDVMNFHCGTFIGGLRGSERGERPTPFRTWLKILTSPTVWAYCVLEKKHFTPSPGRFWVADSAMIKNEIQRYYPIADDRFLIAHSGVDQPAADAGQARIEWRGKLGFKDGDVVVLFVGSEFKRKGLDALLEAMALLKERSPKLVIVGGETLERYQARARELGIGNHITWVGRVGNVKDYYALADIFVLPTLSDPSPLSPLEAMAHGCAAVVSCGRYTGAAELVGEGEAILLEDPKDAKEIAGAIERLLNPTTRQEYTRKGQELTRALSWDHTADVVAEALQKSFYELHHL
jgi:glycosyltransferase involved in cell wall biosynthesis